MPRAGPLERAGMPNTPTYDRPQRFSEANEWEPVRSKKARLMGRSKSKTRGRGWKGEREAKKARNNKEGKRDRWKCEVAWKKGERLKLENDSM
ncbi:hypothetical protein E2C01_076923 [Portunus trituberculatus]|uniref:Uncharacterized protein n=1 Tax=Portunus trituberculatus TaxID=210409 RepID=A0A5B7IN83_PORTR|nr:hypothetical protein [Portunus trituberculatus]